MIDSSYIAWKYLRYSKLRTATLVGCISLIAFLPMALERLLDESEQQLMSRAASTPLVVGAKGSSLDLVMNSIYFGEEVPETITLAAADTVEETGRALPIPLYVCFRARGFPVVGTTLDYFEFRNLEITSGRMLALLGECVVGAKVAEKLRLTAGDSLVTSPDTLFDLAGVYPLKMKVVGVLAAAHNADDLAIFADIKTTWIIQGLGHGHQDVTRLNDPSLILKKSGNTVAASAKLFHYQEINAENTDSFHFHGDLASYPLTAVLAVPHDLRSGTILRGRYLEKDAVHQIIRPEEVIDGLLQNIFRIKNVLDAVIALVAVATVMAIVLVFALSLRLRQREMQTIFKLGCSRLTIVKLLSAEIALILLLSGGICIALAGVVDQFSSELVRMLFIR
jgi:putative ABC transport system permease protein